MVFEEAYNRYRNKIFRLCMGYVNDHEQAKDLTQKTFITVWQQLPKFRGESKIGTWIYRIATNNCLRQIEKDKKFVKAELSANMQEENETSIEPAIQLLYQLISELPETDRIIISLELEDIKQEDIADIVGLSEVNVRVKIHRIKEKLAIRFKHYEAH